MRIQIKDIELVYSEKQQQLINRIKMIINNNYELISSSLGGNKIIDISQETFNFDDFFKYIVYKVFIENDYNSSELNDKDFLVILYSTILSRRSKYDNTSIVPNLVAGDEILSSFIAYKFFESSGNFDSFVDYLKVRDREDELFQWLQCVSRWPTYNYILNVIVNELKSNDEDFFNRFDKVISIFYNRLNDNNQQNITENDYPRISNEEFDTLFYEFLKYINAPDEWVIFYNNLKEKGLIINVGINDKCECVLDDDGTYKIKINNKGNLKGFCNFVHEFIHYISLMNCLSNEEIFKLLSSSGVSEFPSIFFEIIAAEFLEEKGYSNGIVDKINNDREISNFKIIMDRISLFYDIGRYNEHGKVDKKHREVLFRENYKDKTESEISKMVDDVCDDKIDFYLKYGFNVVNGYIYLICTYLVEQVLKKRNDDNSIIEKMVYVTNHLKNLKVDDILSLFGIEDAFDEETIKKVLRKS